MNPKLRPHLEGGAIYPNANNNAPEAVTRGQLPDAIRAIVEALARVQEELDHTARLNLEAASA